MTASEKQSKTELAGVTGLLRHALSLYFKHFSLYFGYAAWLILPLVITVLAFAAFSADVVQIVDFVSLIILTILAIWVSIIFMKMTFRFNQNKKVQPRRISAEAWNLIIPFMLSLVLVELIQLAGTILLIIPGIIFFVWFEFAYVIVALENAPVLASLSMSRELSRGRFWKTLWRLAGGIVIIALFYTVAFAIVFMIGFSTTDLSLIDYASTPPNLFEEIFYRLLDIIFLPLFVIYLTLLYLELKRTK
ncbi:hypothetical protein IH979_02590 [Patescibacteria group bacterium]|nr:hypothetical protein [Patescibacteria group bacterium]